MEFEKRKAATLASLGSLEADKSPKGTLDEPIIPLLHTLNLNPSYFTTSSCSGRISILSQPKSSLSSPATKKKARGGKWLYITHDPAHPDAVLASLFYPPESAKLTPSDNPSELVFRFEPLILAVECKDLASAQSLVSMAITCGFRESGITSCGKRVIIAIRCSIRMEVPLGDTRNLLVSPEYVRFLVGIANDKMEANRKRTDGFFRVLRSYENVDSEIKPALGRVMANGAATDKHSDGGNDGGNHDDFELRSRVENMQIDSGASFSGLEEALDIRVPFTKLSFAGEPVEKLYLWGHSACIIDKNEDRLVIVFGGFGGLGRHARRNETLLLDVLHNTLKSVNAKNSPSPRLGHTSSMVGKHMFVIGGRADPSNILSEAWVLDLSSYQWRSLECGGGEFPPRHRHAAAVVDSNIYVFGGLNNEAVFSSLHVLDTKKLQWKEIIARGEQPCPRHSHAMVAYGSQLFMFGGHNGDKALGDLYSFDVQTSSWKKEKVAGRGPHARFSHSMFVYKHFIGIVGGCPIGQNYQYLALIDMEWQVWRNLRLDTMCKELFVRCTLSVLGDDLIVVGGGAACYAFGTKFTDPVKINLYELVNSADELIGSEIEKKSVPGEDEEVSGKGNTKLPGLQTEEALPQNRGLDVKAKLCDSNCGNQTGSNWTLQLERKYAKLGKDILKRFRWLDPARRVYSHDNGLHIRIPVTENFSALFQQKLVLQDECEGLSDPHESGAFRMDVPLNEISSSVALNILLECGATKVIDRFAEVKKAVKSPLQKMKDAVALLIERRNLPATLLEQLPSRWEQLGDIVVLPVTSFRDPAWNTICDKLWPVIAKSLNARRLARQGRVASTGTRDSTLEVLVGDNGWVDHHENGVLYSFDATRCMFSWGNLSEKLRMGHLNCRDEVIVDLFAGIGYFVLPFLVRAKAKLVYACEWNPHAVEALRRNLHANSVSDRCVVLEGDNRTTAPKRVADRVCLGLLPTSEGSWVTAAQALRPEGGVLHVHGNAKDSEETFWVDHVVRSINDIAISEGHSWEVSVEHVERVKWYAPHVRHLVADIRCIQRKN